MEVKNSPQFWIIVILTATLGSASATITTRQCKNSSAPVSVTLASCHQKVVQESRLNSSAIFSVAIEHREATPYHHNPNASNTSRAGLLAEEVNNMAQLPADHSPKNGLQNEMHFLLARIMSLAHQGNVNQRCLADIGRLTLALHEGHQEVWALKGKNEFPSLLPAFLLLPLTRPISLALLSKTVLDASGDYQPGFMLGNNHWLGSRALCENVAARKALHINYSEGFERSMARDLLSATSPFPVHYAVMHVKHRSPLQFEVKLMSEMVLHIGLCVPSSCSAKEVAALTATHFRTLATEGHAERAFRLDLDERVPIQGKIIKLPPDFKDRLGFKMLR